MYRLHTYDKATGHLLAVSGATTLANAHRIAVNDTRTVDIVTQAR